MNIYQALIGHQNLKKGIQIIELELNCRKENGKGFMGARRQMNFKNQKKKCMKLCALTTNIKDCSPQYQYS